MGAVRMTLSTSSATSVGWRTTRLWRAKLSRPEMMRLQRLAWSTMVSRSSLVSGSSSHSSSSRLACSRSVPSGLLTSWAMPAASWPMLASLPDRSRASLASSSDLCDTSSSS